MPFSALLWLFSSSYPLSPIRQAPTFCTETLRQGINLRHRTRCCQLEQTEIKLPQVMRDSQPHRPHAQAPKSTPGHPTKSPNFHKEPPYKTHPGPCKARQGDMPSPTSCRVLCWWSTCLEGGGGQGEEKVNSPLHWNKWKAQLHFF